MIKYILKKISYSFLVLFGVATIVFFLFNILPGDPADIILGPHATPEAVEKIHIKLGYNRPILTQYEMYLNDLSFISLHNGTNPSSPIFLDTAKYSFVKLFHISDEKVFVLKYPYLRKSYIDEEKVSAVIKRTLPETIVLALSSILLAAILGIVLGVFAALYKDTWVDKCALVFSALNISLPSFVSGLIIMWVFGFVLRDYLNLNHVGSLYTTNDFGERELTLKNLILPTITLGLRPLALIVQLTRSSMLDVLSMDYIRTARAKGVGFAKVVFKHALKNALNPVVTAISGWFAGLMAGAIFVEKIFDWKGIGLQVFDALLKKDLPVVMGATLVFATFFVLINLIVDIIYSFLDPRVRIK
ncbi:MAG: ABC transporter permease [Bacteroidia bacterium]|nr:ABC transporter permease [Bacteroidia bacterium]